MTRRPSNRRHRPLAFSSFARNANLMASKPTKLKQLSSSKSDEKASVNSQDDEIEKGCMKGKGVLSESSSEEESDSEEENGSEEENDGEIVQLDFDFFSPKPEDFHGVKVLLHTYLDDHQWDLSGFVDLILGQTTVGTVVKIEDEDDKNDDCLYSIVTALNLGRYKDTKPIKELKNFLLRACKEKDIVGGLRMLLNEQAQDVGLLVIKHVNNFPPELLPPLYNILFNEVAQAAKHEPTYFKFKVYLLITRIYKLNNANQRKGASKSDSDEPIIYVWPEDEVFHKLSSWTFTFPLRSRPTDEMKNYKPMGLVMALEAKKVPTFQKELQSLISES
ncbi:protein BCCIP homolog [Papaver somniferum]|uniref:protein BCCIP homolog n=1 Tax=Papaver somniferum TaxID=3469 RepID=UPI000E6F6534|nr:protein BCCIP homolog [Papaver somniferum]XP_026412513.1 protein BCCIP homolog [Papaver somniferum]XP_026412514.1 protein BCCIP homolog [Papaver somniferum]XP_026412515.1 protein BCCIP homolog [Papaver somniferum]XP_026412516.1 protein BCCIP homolog [Papaver somniferum]XP_026412517.1 protein BCCIP homolog [Papaver somniferum]XP_026412518.1 protein BCCIP homolog [Papaver somniferum]XP_026412519.1 protein BCCIP homolog [Papaver somniferum]XP_026412520.1 protein BCCIP homolog [Papaver somni